MEKHRTFWRRFIALVIDSILLSIVNFALSMGASFIGDSNFTGENQIRFSIIGAAASLIYPLYFILLHTYYGQTIGKKVARVKVMDDSETPINFGQAVIRSLPQLISALYFLILLTGNEASSQANTFVNMIISGVASVFYLADVIVCLTNDERRALHDFIAGTIVVKTDV